MAMIVADLMAVSDAFARLQHHVFFVAAAAFTIWYILIFHDYRKTTRVLLFLSLPLFVYVAAAVIAVPSARDMLVRTFVPRISATPAA